MDTILGSKDGVSSDETELTSSQPTENLRLTKIKDMIYNSRWIL